MCWRLTQCSSFRVWVCGGPPCHQLNPRDDTMSVTLPTDFRRVCLTTSAPSSEPETKSNSLRGVSIHYFLGIWDTFNNTLTCKMCQCKIVFDKKYYQHSPLGLWGCLWWREKQTPWVYPTCCCLWRWQPPWNLKTSTVHSHNQDMSLSNVTDTWQTKGQLYCSRWFCLFLTLSYNIVECHVTIL